MFSHCLLVKEVNKGCSPEASTAVNTKAIRAQLADQSLGGHCLYL